jgi:guanine deaminase
MCLSAVYWANMKHIYYSANRSDAEHFKFDDAFLYIELRKDKKDRNIPIEEVHLDNRCEPFEAWSAKPGKAVYGGNFVQT